jgi:lactoylglutathione lyase
MPLQHPALFFPTFSIQNVYMKRNALFILLLINFFVINQTSAQTSKPKAVLNHLAIYVVNLQKTDAFYSSVFQLDTIPEPFHDGKHTWYSIAPGVAMHVIQGAPNPKEYYQNNHMCFSVASVDGFVQKIRAQHISWVNAQGVAGQITSRVDGVKQIWVNDPDGYWIEVNDAKQ